MRANFNERRAAAIHEAAHAVIGVQAGNWIRERGVSIEEYGNGYCDIRPRAFVYEADRMRGTEFWRDYEQRATQEIQSLLAGPLAEAHYRFGDWPAVIAENPDTGELSTDFRDAVALLEALYPDHDCSPDSPMLGMSIGDTMNLMEDPETWAAIERLADYLVKYGHVTAERATAIITD